MLLRSLQAASYAALLALMSRSTSAATPNTVEEVGTTLVSAMMMFLGSEEKVYILDKVEGNPTQINNHPAFASEWDIASNKATPMEIITNAFCASGMHFPNGSYATFGGNGAIAPGGNVPTIQKDGTGFFDPTYYNFDGENAVRVLNPCSSTNNDCTWFDNSTKLMSRRWYSTAEPLADGTIVLLGGFVHGGFINRNYPNGDPAYEGGAANPTYEYYPIRQGFNVNAAVVDFLVKTSGLNSYPHMFLMPSGLMFVQANISTMLWDVQNNKETPLPGMPNDVARVYPASGGVAMLPLTPANNYNPTILFCGGAVLEDQEWGNYSWPFINTWERKASADCQRITPEPLDKSPPAYEQDDDMIVGRTMGQFIALPDGTYLMVNGGANGVAGYSTRTLTTPSYADMPYGMSLASEPVLKPAIYNPNAPKGQRWSDAGLADAKYPRLYHSSAILLPDASVLIAGSNPNVDYNVSTIFPTTYAAEKFYPWYFGYTRPNPSGIPDALSYGGDAFDVKLDKSAYSGKANDAAMNTTVVLIRPGFTTHGMNMGQRFMQLNNTYTVGDDGSITLHVAQLPPNANLVQPGPILFYVVVNGVPSNGKLVTVGSGQMGAQTLKDATILPASVNTTADIGGSGSGNTPTNNGDSSSGLSTGALVGLIAGGAAIALLVAGFIFVCLRRRKARSKAEATAGRYDAGGAPGMSNYKTGPSEAFIPLQSYGNNASAYDLNRGVDTPGASRADLHAPALYQDDPRASYDSRDTGFSAQKAPQNYDDYYYDPSPQQHQPRYGNGR